MKVFSEKVGKQLKEMIGELPEKVNIAFFGSEDNCRSCQDTQKFITEFVTLNEKIELHIFDTNRDQAFAEALGIDKVPSIIILDKHQKDLGIRFYGIPAGYEVHSLIAAIKEAGGTPTELSKDVEERIAAIDKKIHIRVFVTPTCPYCPGAVITGHRLALLNENIETDMIEANTFTEEAAKYGVRGVPKIIINEEHEFVGAQPITKFLEVIESI